MVPFETLAEVLKTAQPDLKFTILDVGAHPLTGVEEPYRRAADAFPGSRIIAFELDEKVCAALNERMPPSVRHYAVALGRTEEVRPLYNTVSPLCTSLYKPNEPLLKRYNNLEPAMLKSVSSINTSSLDRFTADQAITGVDFIKIDIQGAELDVFEGGTRTLSDVFAIVTEIEFVPLYCDQPLFGDVCDFLAQQGLMFHKFTDLSGRALKPTLINNDPNHPIQQLWGDAMFIPDLDRMRTLSPANLLKLSALAQLYQSPDLAFHCLEQYDERCGTEVLQSLLTRIG